MNSDERRLAVKKLLEDNPQGIPLRDIKEKFPEFHYYQIYNMLAQLGYKIIVKDIEIIEEVKYVIPGGNINGNEGLGPSNSGEGESTADSNA